MATKPVSFSNEHTCTFTKSNHIVSLGRILQRIHRATEKIFPFYASGKIENRILAQTIQLGHDPMQKKETAFSSLQVPKPANFHKKDLNRMVTQRNDQLSKLQSLLMRLENLRSAIMSVPFEMGNAVELNQQVITSYEMTISSIEEDISRLYQ